MMFTARYSVFVLALLASLSLSAAEQPVVIEDLSWLERRHLESQVEQIDELARMKLGTPVRGNRDDLDLLQRIVYRGLIPRDDIPALQALGAVLGNVMVADLGLEWKVYQDQLGKSRAACVPGGSECLFPITMLSRRMAVGLLPDIEQLYRDASAEIAPHIQRSRSHQKPSI
ncbi:MAG: DUF3806 domain-containing protein [Gammaproteobacteria bacterium]|uniref:DUF3806 domain-containing protein n=1 Tax=Pseudomaricurvus alcaniphilus TaxID=1166482 RepID=UPI001409FBB8|nr:DUF3806 domain-containing protein [Pseudomaricurvus alcaniphilus]MBR9911884.1 DUF3806 domain-containing protein [Gammaproteobacteria bacterium]NHN36065.1 DUF3806 domain-containing protein [Pseudomaricurvus alcaniphilus]